MKWKGNLRASHNHMPFDSRVRDLSICPVLGWAGRLNATWGNPFSYSPDVIFEIGNCKCMWWSSGLYSDWLCIWQCVSRRSWLRSREHLIWIPASLTPFKTCSPLGSACKKRWGRGELNCLFRGLGHQISREQGDYFGFVSLPSSHGRTLAEGKLRKDLHYILFKYLKISWTKPFMNVHSHVHLHSWFLLWQSNNNRPAKWERARLLGFPFVSWC